MTWIDLITWISVYKIPFHYCVLINYDWRDCKRNFNWPRFTTVDVKALSNHAWRSYQSFNLERQYQMWFLYKSDLRISTAEKHYGIIRIKHFKAVKKRRYSPHQLSEKGFKVYRTFPFFLDGSLDWNYVNSLFKKIYLNI